MLITGFTADHMQELANENVVGGTIGADGHLMLEQRDGTLLDAGYFGLAAQVIVGATDFDTLTTPGTYLFMSSTDVAASTNKPTTTAYPFASGFAGFLLVEGNGSTFVKQTWTNYNSALNTLIRTKYNTGWFGWGPPIGSATSALQGVVELATTAEAAAETDTIRAVTPQGLANQKGYRYLQTVLFTASGTFTKATYPGLRAIRIRAVGGGGGGGRANPASTGNHSSGSGGGGGGYAESFVLAAALGTTETVTVGAGGAAPAGQGGDGGTSSFGTKAVAGGGGGGGIASNQTLTLLANPLGAAGVATVGDIKATGSPGGGGWGSGTLGIGGSGGSSMLGGGGIGAFGPGGGATTYGGDGLLYGGGGGGAAANAGAVNGGNGAPGAPGIVIVEVYV